MAGALDFARIARYIGAERSEADMPSVSFRWRGKEWGEGHWSGPQIRDADGDMIAQCRVIEETRGLRWEGIGKLAALSPSELEWMMRDSLEGR